MCLSKERGGMGFWDLRLFNLVLLAKQGWRLQTNSSSLFYKISKAKYFPSCDFVKASMGCQPSYAWRSIIDEDSKEWKRALVCQSFLPQDVDAILSIPLSVTGVRDRAIWAENKNGRFSIRSAYRLA